MVSWSTVLCVREGSEGLDLLAHQVPHMMLSSAVCPDTLDTKCDYYVHYPGDTSKFYLNYTICVDLSSDNG
jgi:hypothetical protein